MFADLWVGVFAGEVSEVTEDLALHVVFQGGEPAVGLIVHRVVQLHKLHQLLCLHLIRQRDRFFKKTPLTRGKMTEAVCLITKPYTWMTDNNLSTY